MVFERDLASNLDFDGMKTREIKHETWAFPLCISECRRSALPTMQIKMFSLI